ncbi:MAG TPA: hypothetical protein VGF30_08505 [Bacteroidia bacterium]
MKQLYIVILSILILTGYSQDKSFTPSLAYVQTSYHNQLFYSNKESATITYDETAQSLVIKLDFAKLETKIDSLDEWLLDLEQTQLIYKTQLNPEDFPTPGNLVSKTLKLPGTITFNNQANNVELNLTIFEVSEQGMLYREFQNGKYDKFRLRFSIAILPKDYKIDKKEHHLKKAISVQVSNGIINLIPH